MESKSDASKSLLDGPVVGNEEVDNLPAVDVSHREDAAEEAWFSEDFCEDIELHNEWKLRRDKLYTAGYREGILEGQKDAAQDGFNEGCKESVLVGYNWGIVRGITSAFAHLPDELKEKLFENDEARKGLLKLHNAVDSIATGNALKLYYDTFQREKSSEQSSIVKSGPTTQQIDSGGLETYTGKLVKLCPEISSRLSISETR